MVYGGSTVSSSKGAAVSPSSKTSVLQSGLVWKAYFTKRLATCLISIIHFKISEVFYEQMYVGVYLSSSSSLLILTSKLMQHLDSVGAFAIDNGI